MCAEEYYLRIIYRCCASCKHISIISMIQCKYRKYIYMKSNKHVVL
jgi:hypothetical protein